MAKRKNSISLAIYIAGESDISALIAEMYSKGVNIDRLPIPAKTVGYTLKQWRADVQRHFSLAEQTAKAGDVELAQRQKNKASRKWSALAQFCRAYVNCLSTASTSGASKQTLADFMQR